MNIERALRIEGFMSEGELIQLAHWAAQYRRIVEIGSYMGRSTRAMADNTQGTVIAIDDFMGLRENEVNPEQNVIRDSFSVNLADHLASGKVILKEMGHDRPPNIICDMVFIDGSHDSDSVRRDILAWQFKTTQLLCGHDFDAAHPDVQRAVDDLLSGYRVVSGTSLWWVRK